MVATYGRIICAMGEQCLQSLSKLHGVRIQSLTMEVPGVKMMSLQIVLMSGLGLLLALLNGETTILTLKCGVVAPPKRILTGDQMLVGVNMVLQDLV